MAKKYFQKALSVGLSLALCAGMVAPGFAASFKDLQDAIDGANTGTEFTRDEQTYWGYGGMVDGTENYAVEATTGQDDEGNDTRVVTLYEDVENARRVESDGNWGVKLSEGSPESAESSIVIENGKNVTLDLNGKKIDMNPGWSAQISDQSAGNSQTPDFEDGNGNSVSVFNSWKNEYLLNCEPIIKVESKATLTLEDSGAKWTGNLHFDPSATDSLPSSVPEYKGGKITGGGYEAIENQGKLIMNSGELSGNGLEAVQNYGDFVMNGGVIRNNRFAVQNSGRFTMNGGQISENNGYGTIGLMENGTFTMKDGLIVGNRVATSVVYASTGFSPDEGYDDSTRQLFIQGGTIYGNNRDEHRRGGMLASNLGTVTLPEGSDPVQANKGGSIDFPAGTKIKQGNTEYVSVNDGIHVDIDDTVSGSYVSKVDWGGSVIITDTNKGTHDITLPKGENGETKGEVTVGTDGTTTVPEGGKITDTDGTETTYPNGTTIDKNGNVNGKKDDNTTDPSVTKTENSDGSTTIKTDNGNGDKTETKVEVPEGENGEKAPVTVDDKGTTHVPEGGKITDTDGNETTYPNGTTIDKNGNITGGSSVTKTENSDGSTTIKTDNGKDGEDKKTTENTVTLPKDENGETKGEVTVDDKGNTNLPEGSTVTDKDGNEYELPEGGKITEDGKVVDKDGNLVEPKKDDTNAGGGTGVTGGTDVVVIDGVEVPLAGLVSVEDVLSVLYRLAEGVEGERDQVVAWAVENGIIDEETDVEELVTVAALRSILANYARAFELDVDVTTLATLTGEDDDIVMNCDEVIDEFFTKAEEDEAA